MCTAYCKEIYPSLDPEQPYVDCYCEAIRAAEWECNACFEFVPRTYEDARQIPCLNIIPVDDDIPF